MYPSIYVALKLFMVQGIAGFAIFKQFPPVEAMSCQGVLVLRSAKHWMDEGEDRCYFCSWEKIKQGFTVKVIDVSWAFLHTQRL